MQEIESGSTSSVDVWKKKKDGTISWDQGRCRGYNVYPYVKTKTHQIIYICDLGLNRAAGSIDRIIATKDDKIVVHLF